MTPISGAEFKTWLTNFIVDKNGKIPDKEDWREIKSMLDRIPDDVPALNSDEFIAQWMQMQNWESTEDEYTLEWYTMSVEDVATGVGSHVETLPKDDLPDIHWEFPHRIGDTFHINVSPETLAKELQYIKDDMDNNG